MAREYEVFTVVPVKETSNGSRFAPIGLIRMFNSGGAVKEVGYGKNICVKARGCGTFGAYSSVRPKRITDDTEEVQFHFEEASGLVTLDLPVPVPVPERALYLWTINIEL